MVHARSRVSCMNARRMLVTGTAIINTTMVIWCRRHTQVIRASIPCRKSQWLHKMRPCFMCTLPTIHAVPVVSITWLPPSFTHLIMFITLQQHVTGRWERGRATPQLRLRTSTVLVFRLHLLMAILEVSLLQTRLWLDIMRRTQVTVVLLAYVCGTQSIVHQELL